VHTWSDSFIFYSFLLQNALRQIAIFVEIWNNKKLYKCRVVVINRRRIASIMVKRRTQGYTNGKFLFFAFCFLILIFFRGCAAWDWLLKSYLSKPVSWYCRIPSIIRKQHPPPLEHSLLFIFLLWTFTFNASFIPSYKFSFFYSLTPKVTFSFIFS
jgi:hypothetical protein